MHPPYRGLILALLLAFAGTDGLVQAQAVTDQIRLNQIGFYPQGPKTVVVVDPPATTFYLVTPDGADTVYTGTLSAEGVWEPSGERVRRADFTEFETPGSYAVLVPEVGHSYPFEIGLHVHQDLVAAAVKMYYFQRASTALEEAYAGPWARPAGHPDAAVRSHPSAATDARPAGSTIASPKGWYDAGDYNKYVVNSGISTGTLLMLYEHYPTYFDALETTIPESGNGVPDLLDEILWNVRWLLTMQDPGDGGVYNKVTHANFSGTVMPHQATAPRYVVQKGTAATLDFAAVMALATRIYAGFEADLPGLADSLQAAALDAWDWAVANPDVSYDQGAMNAEYDPDINTGGYGDSSFADEFAWAAAELYVTTGEERFATAFNEAAPSNVGVPGWPNVAAMGFYSLVQQRADVAGAIDTTAVKQRLLAQANHLVEARAGSAFGIVMGSANGFWWGSNSEAANQGMLLLQAYRLTGEPAFFEAALSNLDYLLGRNGVGASFVTGYGDRTPMHPHHRPSEADNVQDPVPGMLVGGPHAGGEDVGSASWQCDDYRDEPANSWIDDWCSYATNEITINWNAPLAYLAGGIEASLSPTGAPTASEPEDGVTTLPKGLHLVSYPNPVSATAHVQFSLNDATAVTLQLFDVLGRKVATLADGSVLSAGTYERALDTHQLPSGIYLLRLETSHHTASWSMIVMH